MFLGHKNSLGLDSFYYQNNLPIPDAASLCISGRLFVKPSNNAVEPLQLDERGTLVFHAVCERRGGLHHEQFRRRRLLRFGAMAVLYVPRWAIR